MYDEKNFNYKRKYVLPLFFAVFRNHHILKGVGLVLFWFFSALFSTGRARVQNVVRRQNTGACSTVLNGWYRFIFFFWIYTKASLTNTGVSYEGSLKSDARLFPKKWRFFFTKLKRIVAEIHIQNLIRASNKSLILYGCKVLVFWCCAKRNKIILYVLKRDLREERCQLFGKNKRIKWSKRNREDYDGIRFKTCRSEEHSRRWYEWKKRPKTINNIVY